MSKEPKKKDPLNNCRKLGRNAFVKTGISTADKESEKDETKIFEEDKSFNEAIEKKSEANFLEEPKISYEEEITENSVEVVEILATDVGAFEPLKEESSYFTDDASQQNYKKLV